MKANLKVNLRVYTAQDILWWQYNSDTEDFKRLDYSCYEPFVDEYFKKYGDKLHIIENGGRNGLKMVEETD